MAEDQYTSTRTSTRQPMNDNDSYHFSTSPNPAILHLHNQFLSHLGFGEGTDIGGESLIQVTV